MELSICKFEVDYQDHKGQMYEIYVHEDKTKKRSVQIRWRRHGFWTQNDMDCDSTIVQRINHVATPYLTTCIENIESFSDMREAVRAELKDLFKKDECLVELNARVI